MGNLINMARRIGSQCVWCAIELKYGMKLNDHDHDPKKHIIEIKYI